MIRLSAWVAGVLVVVAGASGCSDAARAGTLAATAGVPTVTCTTGVGGVLTISNIPSTASSAKVTWNFGSFAGQTPVDGFGFIDPASGAPTPAGAVITLASPPWSAAKSTSSPAVKAVYTYTDQSTLERSVSCTKGTDSPTPTLTCQSDDPGSTRLNARVNVLTSSVSSLGSSANYAEADWWWKGVEIWQVVLQPWISVIPDTWTSVAYAERTEHVFNSASTSEYQSYESTEDLPLPSNFAGGYIGHVRVQVVDERRRPISFPAEVDCP